MKAETDVSRPFTTTGAWVIHVVLIVMGKIIIDSVPGMTQEISWTLVNLTYLSVRHFDYCSEHS